MSPNAPILIAEDNENDAFILKRALQQGGATCPVRFCKDGLDARAYLCGEGPYSDRREFVLPCLVITDLKMPKMDGLELLKWLRGHPDFRLIPTIILSASGQSSDINQAYEFGVNSYLVKPSGYKELVEVVKLILSYWRACEKPTNHGKQGRNRIECHSPTLQDNGSQSRSADETMV